ncbi:MAG: DNA polymerase I [Actinomycetota bacterium]
MSPEVAPSVTNVTKKKAKERLFLLDGHSLSFRAFFALPPTLATSTGQVTNAVYGFTSMLIKLLTDERPDGIAVAFDKGPPTVRLEQYAEYKAGRAEAPDEFRQQLPLIREVLDALRIPVFEVEGHEADDAIATLALRAVAAGFEVVIVTADRDFFQLVRPGISVMFNRRGITDIVLYDEAAVEERFGLSPDRYLDYVALKGDPSDNIPGIPGVGEKTASRLVREYGSVEDIISHAEELSPKLRTPIAEAAKDLIRNKEIARLQTNIELDLEPAECRMGAFDPPHVRQLFSSLEFRSLLERLEEATASRPGAQVEELDVQEAEPEELPRLLSGSEPCAVVLSMDSGKVTGVAISAGGGRATHVRLNGEVPDELRTFLAEASRALWVHDAREVEAHALGAGIEVDGVAFDTLLAGYLLDPAAGSYPLGALSERYLGADLVGAATPEEEGQLPLGESWRRATAEAAVVALLVPVLETDLERSGTRSLLGDMELPLSRVLARMQATGIALDVAYLTEMSDRLGDRMAGLETDIYAHAGEEFNLNSPPQLRLILFEKLGLRPVKRTKTGYSTDADTLEKLRDEHPIAAALLDYREVSKLKSTYLDALPPLVNPETGRVHTTFSQTAAATGRLSSFNPNLQNIPVRGELGREIRRAFIPGVEGWVLVVADYSQIELRVLAHLSGDEGLAEAFASDADIHAATAAKIFGLPPEQIDAELRRRAKAVNYGLAYGMNAYGLATRLRIPPDEAQAFIDAYFEGFPRVREFLDRQVDAATRDGYTSTMLGRRRYLPELQSANPRIRDLGRRQALNAPIQGSAADIIKLAMIEGDRAIETLPASMLLTVHDELVFEVEATSQARVEAAVRTAMESAYELSVPLRVDIGSGLNWAEAAPAGH